MATLSPPARLGNPDYPTSDGKPMAETDYHYKALRDAREALDLYFASDPQVYVTGNLLLFYEPGNKRRHVSPDVMVVKGVSKGERLNYIVWEEGKGPDVVIELTSSSTRREDRKKKFQLYQDVLKVQEYFLCDPLFDYLRPPLQGYRLDEGKYVRIEPVSGRRLPSEVLGLHLEQEGTRLRFYDPAAGRWLPTPLDAADQSGLQRMEARMQRLEEIVQRTEAENERLRRELAELQRRLGDR